MPTLVRNSGRPLEALVVVEFGKCCLHGDCAQAGVLGVVVVGARCIPHGKDGIAEERSIAKAA
jgi:hypothetical protein